MLAIATLLVFLPFVGKPLHIDDPLFVWTAQHIQSDPWSFYGFDVNWHGYVAPTSDMVKNPPLASYYFAATAFLLGFGEVGLHLAALVPAIAATLGTFELARLFCGRPFLASLLALTTPVFVLCGTSLMCDMPLLALWCWSLVCWHRGLHSRRGALLFCGAVLAALAALTKYFGLCLIPLLLVDALEVRRRASLELLWLALPVAVMAAYQHVTRSLYGFGLLSDAGAYASRTLGSADSPHNMEAFFRTLLFFGGCVLGVVAIAPRLWSRATWLLGAAVIAATAWTSIYDGWADFSHSILTVENAAGWNLLIHMVLFLGAGATALGLVATELATRRSTASFFLAAWLLGTLVFAGCINWSLNGRSFLPAVPVLAILVVRRLEQLDTVPRARLLWGELRWKDGAPLLIGLAAALFVAAGDYSQATSARTAAATIARDFSVSTRQFSFLGHWGFQYYLESYGAVSLDASQGDFAMGDLIAVPQFNSNRILLPEGATVLTREISHQMPLPVTTMRVTENAGFYAARYYGRLPWRIGPVPPDLYLIQTVQRPFRLRVEPPNVH